MFMCIKILYFLEHFEGFKFIETIFSLAHRSIKTLKCREILTPATKYLEFIYTRNLSVDS